ncbi:glucose-6-phosphate isomerase family protein [Candidatus Poribacteria bacterium]
MREKPFTFDISSPSGIPTRYENHIVRRLSAMKGQYADLVAYEAMLARDDVVLYEVYEIDRPKVSGELMNGISMVHPGKVGEEYFMTKGHFHAMMDTAELYYCLQGEGVMVMETPEGDWAVEELRPGIVLYIPPYWAHRSVNTSAENVDLVTYFVYPGHAGHDYSTIETQGFRKLIVERDGQRCIVDNPRCGTTRPY